MNSFFANPKETKCKFCNSIINEDGSAVSCLGECDREPAIEDDYRPLNFDNDEVVRDLPDPADMWPGFNEDYEEDIDDLDVDAGVVDYE